MNKISKKLSEKRVTSASEKGDVVEHSPYCPRWTRRKEARPDEIMDAALDLFIEKGFAATRLDDVAKKAGVSKGTLYLYFSDKEDLFRKVVENGMVPQVKNLEDVIKAHTGSIDELVVKVVKGLTTLVTTTKMGAMPKLMISEIGNFPKLGEFYRDEVILRLHRTVGTIIEMGIARGEFREVPVLEAARDLLAPIFMMAIASNMPGFSEHLLIDADAQAEVTIDLWLRGIRKSNLAEEPLS
jgi:AcrR family transcriptional regulator